MKNKSIVLLNLPFARPLQRDYGCPHGVKADYYWPPIDLLLFGAIARGAGILSYIDAIAGRLDEAEVLREIVKLDPEIIFTILSSISIESDLRMLGEIRRLVPQASIWASGDVIFFGEARYEGIDVYVRDLTNGARILEFLHEERIQGEIPVSSGKTFSVGICPHDLTTGYPYAMPFSLFMPIASVLTNYGCTSQCAFCNSKELPFKIRALDEVIEELATIERLGIREVVFRDFTFNASDVDALCDGIEKRGIRLAWSCWTRADLVDEYILGRMKKAGCYLVSYGIESGDDTVLKSMRKNISIARASESVVLTRQAGIEVLASFIIGFPFEDLGKTIAGIFRLDPDYLALNLLVERFGSRRGDDGRALACGGNVDSLLSANQDLVVLRDATEKRFYLRPRRLLRYLRLSLKSRQRLRIFLRNAAGLARRWRSAPGDRV